MRKSIKIMVGLRIAAAFIAVLLFSTLTTRNIINMEHSEEYNIEVNALLQRAQKAEVAHYKWSANLSNACMPAQNLPAVPILPAVYWGSGFTASQGQMIRQFWICGARWNRCIKSFMHRLPMFWK